jgi:hypothetical protein
VLTIFAAIFFTFLSRQETSGPNAAGDAALLAELTHKPWKSRGALSFGSLTDVLDREEHLSVAAEAWNRHKFGEGALSASEKGALAEAQPPRPGYVAVATGGAVACQNKSAEWGAPVATPEEGNVLLGLMLSAFAGCVDGSWSSLTLTAKLSGVDNYVAASYFCVGLLVPLAVIETTMYLRDPLTWTANVKKVTLGEWAFVALSGFLNIFAVSFRPDDLRALQAFVYILAPSQSSTFNANSLLKLRVCVLFFLQIITYFMATVVISSAVAFAIFLSTPLVSIALGACVLRELDDEPLRKKLLVAAIIGLYVVAIGTLASNALATP